MININNHLIIIYQAVLAHFPTGQSATFYTHHTGELKHIEWKVYPI